MTAIVSIPPSPSHGKRPVPDPAMSRSLLDQIVLVTGANAGIGRAVAIGLARAGADARLRH